MKWIKPLATRLASRLIFNYLSYRTHEYLLRDGATNSELCLSTSAANQGKPPLIYTIPQARLSSQIGNSDEDIYDMQEPPSENAFYILNRKKRVETQISLT